MSLTDVQIGAWNVIGAQEVGKGEETYLVTAKTSADEYYKLLNARGIEDSKIFTSLATAEAAMTSARNDKLVIFPGSHSLAANPNFANNMCTYEGTHYGPRMNKRSRIGMSTTFSPFITVSGYGNTFKNLYSMHGTESTDYIGWLISGERNSFYNMHFGGPMNAAQGGHASYEGVAVDGTETYFNGCVFGTETIGRDETSPNVTLGAGTHTIFENCTFLCMLTDGDPVFIAVENASGVTHADFINCRFIAISENMLTSMTYAFKFSAGSTAIMSIDAASTFVNVAHLATSANMKYIWTPTVFAATADELNKLSINSATY